MRRSLPLAAVLAASMAAALGTGSALAGQPQVGGCPDGFTSQPLSYLNNFSVGGLQSADLNGNGLTCVKLLNTPSDIVFVDDVVRP